MTRPAVLLVALAALAAASCERSPVAFIAPDSVPTRLVEEGAEAVFGIPYCGGGAERTLDLYRPPIARATPTPLVVHVHGGAWRVGDKRGGPWFDRVGRALLARGFALASVDYRLAPGDPWPRPIDDVRCALSFLADVAPTAGLDPSRIGIFGTSAGAHLAAMGTLTDERVPVAFAGLYGIYDLTGPDLSELIRLAAIDAFGVAAGTESPVLEAASPVRLASADDVPTLLVHGSEDSVVPPGQSVRMADALEAAGAPVELILVARAEHQFVPTGETIDPSEEEITAKVVGFLEERLR